jgi:hypothetical protein
MIDAVPDQSASERWTRRRREGDPKVRPGRASRRYGSCSCRRAAAGRPRCTRLHIPKVHLVV